MSDRHKPTDTGPWSVIGSIVTKLSDQIFLEGLAFAIIYAILVVSGALPREMWVITLLLFILLFGFVIGARLFLDVLRMSRRLSLVVLAGSLSFGCIGVMITLFAVTTWQEPSVLINPMISTAVAKTIAAQAVPIPPVAAVVSIIDSNGDPLTREGPSFLLVPGQKVTIKIEQSGIKNFSWELDPLEFGLFEGSTRGAEVTFIAPKTTEQPGAVNVCDLDPNGVYSCQRGAKISAVISLRPK